MSKRKEREMRLYKGWIEKIKEVTEMFKRRINNVHTCTMPNM